MMTICKYGSNQYNLSLNRLINRYQWKHSFACNSSLSSNVKKYNDRRILGYSKQQLYDMVSRIELYDQFVPNITKSLVTRRSKTMVIADIEISVVPIFRDQFSFDVRLLPPNSVISESSDSRIFNYLKSEWKFSDGVPNNVNSCAIDYSILFELKSQFHYQLANLFFDRLASKTVDAFIKRAQTLYGKQYISNNKMLYKS